MVHQASADFGSEAGLDFMVVVAEATKVLDLVSAYCIVRSLESSPRLVRSENVHGICC